MYLAERDMHLGILEETLAAARSGDGRVVLADAAPGIGKTALLHAFAQKVREAGIRLLDARCSLTEQALPLGVFGQLLLPTEHAGKAEALLDTPWEGPAAVRALNGLCRLILDLAAAEPLVLLIDDAHYADPQSLEGLLQLIRRLPGARVLVVATELTGPADCAELARLPHSRQLRIEPLSPDGVREVLAKRFDADAAERLAPDWHASTGGNPLLLHALADDQKSSTVDAFGQAVLACLHSGTPEFRLVAQGVAALGEAATPARVSTLMTADPDEVARAWRLLELTGLTAKHAFRHPATAAAVLGELRKPERAGLHQRAARLLHTEGAEPAEVAARLLAADRAIDPWMVSVLLDGSDQFLSRDDVPRAIECLKLAHRGCTDDRQRAAIRSQLVRAEGRADPVAAGRHLPDMVTALQHNQLPPRHLITLIRQLVWTGKPDDALGALNLLISTADPADAELATEIRIIRLWLSCWQPRLAARIPGKQAPPVSGPATRVDLRLRAIEALAAALQRPGSEGTVSEAEQVLQCLHLRENTVEPALYALLALLYADQGALALPWCTRLMADAAERKAPAWQANFTSIRSEIAMSQGEPALAEEYATAALELVGPREWGAAIGGPMATLMLASTMMGKDAAVAELLHRPVPDQLFETRFGLRYLHARGRHYLATARPRAALADFLACGDLAAEWGLDVSATSPWPTDAAEVLIQLEEPDEARKLLERQLDILGEHRTRSRGMALRVLAQAGGPAGRRSLLTESVELLEAAGDAVELARALADLGDACRAAGDVDEGRKLARRSWRLAKAAKVLASARTAHLGPVPQKPPGGREPVALSDAERRVAELITAGYTNREIARQLFITVSTVEQHVTRIYRKLAVKRRDELAARYQEYLAWTAESA